MTVDESVDSVQHPRAALPERPPQSGELTVFPFRLRYQVDSAQAVNRLARSQSQTRVGDGRRWIPECVSPEAIRG